MIYQFEEIGLDLPTPPLAARRALMNAGVSMPQTTWSMLSIEARQAIVKQGTNDSVEAPHVQSLVSSVLRNVRLMGSVKDPPLEAPPEKVSVALAGIRPITNDEWRRLRPLDRYTLNVLCSNGRLLWRALAEMGTAGVLSAHNLQHWVGWLARSELRVAQQCLGELAAGRIQDGKAIVVARAVGLRASRKATEWLDGYAEVSTGPIELDARVDLETGTVLWQAHVSTTDGEFFSAAALIAATTAAIALRDAISMWDPVASISDVGLREEAWVVGSGAFGEEATMVTFDARKMMAKLEAMRSAKGATTVGLSQTLPLGPPGVISSIAQPAPPQQQQQLAPVAPPVSARQTKQPAIESAPNSAPPSSSNKRPAKRGAPMWMLVAMFILTLLSLASAVVALMLKKP